jgi:hypothetical protein
MRVIYRAFKKHYLLCKDIYRKMAATGGFEFKLRVTPASGEATLATPDAELTMRFVVVMRRFLDPADRLYYKAVWATLQEEFGDAITGELKAAIDKKITILTNGVMRFEIGGEVLTAERMYEIIADGVRFGRNERYMEYLRRIELVPMVGPLLWHQFYSYTESALALASLLCDAISVAEKTDVYSKLYGEIVTAKCMYCLSTEGPFTSEEHIVAESMGNQDFVLPRGYVCDPCNNGVLSRLDDALRTSPLFVAQWASAVQFTKQGKLPEVRLGEITIRRTDPLNVSWIADPGSEAVRVVKQHPDGLTELSIRTKLAKRLDEVLVARALCKIGLGALAMDFGHAYACSSRFDAARRFIREGGEFRNNLLVRQWMTMRSDMQLEYYHVPEVPGTVMLHRIYGVLLLMNLEEEPKLQLNPDLRRVGFVSFPLFGKRRRTTFKMRMVPESGVTT